MALVVYDHPVLVHAVRKARLSAVRAVKHLILGQQEHLHPLVGRIVQLHVGVQNLRAHLQAHDPAVSVPGLSDHIMQRAVLVEPLAGCFLVLPVHLPVLPAALLKLGLPLAGKCDGIAAVELPHRAGDIPVTGGVDRRFPVPEAVPLPAVQIHVKDFRGAGQMVQIVDQTVLYLPLIRQTADLRAHIVGDQKRIIQISG